MIDQFAMPNAGELTAVINTTLGAIKVRFFPEVAPKAVENFTTHAKNGYYDGIIFHRVIKDFMIQGGDPLGRGIGGESIWGAPFEDEFSEELKVVRGALCMANAGPFTNGSQFFIVQCPACPWLDFHHTVFGQVIEGIDVVDAIANVKVGFQDKPVEDVKIISIDVDGSYNFE